MTNEASQREVALRYIRRLTEKSLVEFFYEALRERCGDEQNEFRDHFVLATAENVEGTRPDGIEKWALGVVGLPSDDRPWSDSAVISQFGTCKGCGLEIGCWSKQIRCPVCSRDVSGT